MSGQIGPGMTDCPMQLVDQVERNSRMQNLYGEIGGAITFSHDLQTRPFDEHQLRSPVAWALDRNNPRFETRPTLAGPQKTYTPISSSDDRLSLSDHRVQWPWSMV